MTGKKRPNVIVVMSDEQRWDTLGVHGNPMGLTPNLDRIAREGTLFDLMFTPQPVCTPARSCLQTGLYATQAGCYRNELALQPDQRSLAHEFGDAGYDTAYIGKWHLGGMLEDTTAPGEPMQSPQDWMKWYLAGKASGPVPERYRGGYQHWLGANLLEFTSEPYDCVVQDNEGNPVKLPGYRVDALADVAIRYITEHQDNPFFLFLSFMEPHPQNRTGDYPAPDGYAEQYTGGWMPPDLAALCGTGQGIAYQSIGGYYGMVKRLDEAVGRLRDALKSLNMSEDTVVLYTCDHGEHFGTRKPGGSKRTCHEASIRIPTVATGPGFRGGGTLSELISLIDLPPSLLDAAGLPIPERMMGRSGLPLTRGEPVDWPDDVYVQIWGNKIERAVRTRRWKYCVEAPDADPWYEGVATRYVEKHLYDLHADPYELHDLIGYRSHQEVARVMGERLLKHVAEVDGVDAKIEQAPELPSDQRVVFPEELCQ